MKKKMTIMKKYEGSKADMKADKSSVKKMVAKAVVKKATTVMSKKKK